MLLWRSFGSLGVLPPEVQPQEVVLVVLLVPVVLVVVGGKLPCRC